MAMASAKISRPQPCSFDIGVRKKPIVERGPKLIAAMAQPAMMTSGTERTAARATGEASVMGRIRGGEGLQGWLQCSNVASDGS